MVRAPLKEECVFFSQLFDDEFARVLKIRRNSSTANGPVLTSIICSVSYRRLVPSVPINASIRRELVCRASATLRHNSTK